MKIIKIEFENINNLKGQHVINFDQDPLSSAGIFAITGPTGSGKSSILDVITLSLFNRIPRFKKAISKSEVEGLGSVITHLTATASAKITYQIKEKRYQSSWSISKARTGNLRDYEMSICDDATGVFFDLKRKEVPAKNEEIIGLNYDQFVKSILLSQGEFSKFLKADKNERGKLLENITGTSIYREIGKAAFEKSKLQEEKVSKEKEMLNSIETLSEEERKEIELAMKNGATNKIVLEKDIVALRGLKMVKTTLGTLSKNIKKKKQVKTDLAEAEKSFQPQLERLQLSEKLMPLQADFMRYNDAKKNIESFQHKIITSKNELETTQSKLKKIIFSMGELTHEIVDEDNFKKVMSDFENEINTYDTNLKNIESRGKEERERIDKRKSNFRLALPEMPEKAILKLKSYQEKLLSTIQKADLEVASDLEELKLLQTKRQAEKIILENISRINLRIKELDQQILTEKSNLEKIEGEIKTKRPKYQELSKQVEELEKQKYILQKDRETALAFMELKDRRAELVGEKPCPLCGALHHPYAEDLPKFQSEIDKKIEKNKIELKSNLKLKTDLKEVLIKCNTNVESTQKTILEKQNEITAQKENCKKAAASYQGNQDLSNPDLLPLITELSNKVEIVNQAITAIGEIKIAATLEEDFQDLQDITIEYKELKDKKDSRYSGGNISVECHRLQDDFLKNNITITKVNTSIEKDTSELDKNEQIFSTTNERLKPKIKALGFDKIEMMSEAILAEATEQKLKLEKQSLEKRTIENETELRNLLLEKDKNIKLDHSPQIELEVLNGNLLEKENQRESLVEKMATQLEQLKRDDIDGKKLKQKKLEIEKLEVDLHKWKKLTSLIGDRTGSKFSNFAQGITLQNLLVFANKRLRKLSDRYLLDKPTNDGALMIIDQYQGNIQRSVSTLSGGESFLVSLALALSLSDMASKNVSLDSLFIDEGFGTLDQETLDVALNTLEKLQSESQKMVGVISHVEALKERIQVQIKLEKNPQGYSSIEVK
jgi:exonuclease SbcC